MNRSTVRRLREEITHLYSALITGILCRVFGFPGDIDKLKRVQQTATKMVREQSKARRN